MLERRLRVLRWSIGLVLAAGLASCISRGADAPADPELGAPDASTTTSGGGSGSGSGTGDSSLAAQFGTIMVELLTSTGEAVQLCLFHADTGPERGQGLMGVTDFEGYDGMLFSNPTPVDNQFYMAGTPTPLSITWWQQDGSFRNATDMEPCTSTDFAECRRYPSEGSYVWAIEVPQGALDGRGIDADTTLSLGAESCTPV